MLHAQSSGMRACVQNYGAVEYALSLLLLLNMLLVMINAMHLDPADRLGLHTYVRIDNMLYRSAAVVLLAAVGVCCAFLFFFVRADALADSADTAVGASDDDVI